MLTLRCVSDGGDVQTVATLAHALWYQHFMPNKQLAVL